VRRAAGGWIAGKCFFGKAVTALLTAVATLRPRILVTSRWRIKNAGLISTLRPALALLLPLRIGPLQQILGAGTAQMRAAILHHHLAIDVAGPI
jgi:Lon protease-like protein